jgi:hypothetical protein
MKAKYRILKHLDPFTKSPYYTIQVPMLFGFLWADMRDIHNKKVPSFRDINNAILCINKDLCSKIKDISKPKVVHDLKLDTSDEGLQDLRNIIEFNSKYPMNEDN